MGEMEPLQRWHQTIDNMTLRELLYTWRMAPAGRFPHDADETKYILTRMREERQAHPDEWVAASKEIGWNSGRSY